MTLNQLYRRVAQGQKFSVLTAYDAGFARLAQQAGIDLLLIGDSLGMVVQGEDTTLGVTTDDLIYHARLVAKGAPETLRMVDMPFGSGASESQALSSAVALLSQGKAHVVKMEVSHLSQLNVVETLVRNGIPVCVHLGLLPQWVLQRGYRVAGRGQEAEYLLQLAQAAEQAGAALLLLEGTLASVAQTLVHSVTIPTIGIGAGNAPQGQVLVMQDILGITPQAPSFSQNFLQGQDSILAAFQAYDQAVKNGQFPQDHHAFWT